MIKLNINKVYSINQIEQYVTENPECELIEYGKFSIGENFLVLTNGESKTTSFVLVSHSDQSYFKCIYKAS